MRHSRFTGAQGFIAIAMTASLGAVAQAAGPERTIFAAENALYGAGFDVGKADGWMDNALRSAIRDFQSGHDDLETTGNLDSKTLSALGVAATDNNTITGNAVSDRKDAMAAIGLEPERFASSGPTRSVAAAPEPEPEPEVEPVAEAQPEPAPVAQPEPDTTEVAESTEENTVQEPVDEPAPEPEVAATEPAASPADAEVTKQPAEPQPVPEVSEVVTDDKESPEERAEAEPAVEEEAESATVEIVAVEEVPDIESQLPDEPTGAGNPEASEPAQVARTSTDKVNETSTANNGTTHQSSGGFFSSIFDFLFGWLI
ncbi:peptidoglycan-binding domain-containing protein [Marinobacter sp. HL-58]|uniref:peptidoglycan-binding domain-containing protein n=1 Tax=Marinobacter sp. HL-58 TaxID=1479237 RepID=UPI00068DF430|nr:peptidoglycan-binding domain-containing protein [Marinobacter sp. HL-58]KPQ01599.1 MAG: putative peptidoglycan binding domain [Marinobacter sp. HL-58]